MVDAKVSDSWVPCGSVLQAAVKMAAAARANNDPRFTRYSLVDVPVDVRSSCFYSACHKATRVPFAGDADCRYRSFNSNGLHGCEPSHTAVIATK